MMLDWVKVKEGAMVSIVDSENKIFAEWAATRPGLVSDGVANESKFVESKEKILFILKEVNDRGGGAWDLRQFMCEGGRSQTWDNITRWVDGIRALPDDIPWNRLSDITVHHRINTLQSIAAINLKKSPGGHTTITSELEEVAREDRVYLSRQFSLYCADWVICCGADVTRLAHELIVPLVGASWKCTSRGVEFHEYLPKKFVVAFSHPEARVADYLLHYGLIDAIREIQLFQHSRRSPGSS